MAHKLQVYNKSMLGIPFDAHPSVRNIRVLVVVGCLLTSYQYVELRGTRVALQSLNT